MDTEIYYQQTLDYLYRFVDHSMTRVTRNSPEQFNLERMFDFVKFLGHPEQTYPIIHIAGTKGKGSVSALCASALQAAGYKVGLYTSPHLTDYAERIQINRQPIPHADLVVLVDKIRPYLDQGTKLTTFEITTGLAFLYFSDQDVDAAVIEVGLGGRLDATNVITPSVSVITSLSYDHTQYLGDTLTKIAAEKAGIIKNGVPVVLAPQKDEARLIIKHVASENAAALVEVGRDYLFTELTHSLASGQTMVVWSVDDYSLKDTVIESGDLLDRIPTRLSLPLLGRHQIENAATAYAALQVFRQRALPLDESDIQHGFANVSWPGRFEILQLDPPVVLDCAHNRDSAMKLRQTLDDYFPDQPIIMVFGASEDKDIQGIFAELLPRVNQVIVTRSIHPRAAEPGELVTLAQHFGRPVQAIEKVEEAFAEAIRLADGQAVVLVTGSIFVAAAARDTWYNHL